MKWAADGGLEDLAPNACDRPPELLFPFLHLNLLQFSPCSID